MEVFHSFSKILLFIIQQLLRPDWIPGTVWGIASEYNIDKIQFFPTSSSFFNMWTKDRIYASNNIWLYRGLISAGAAAAKSLQACPTLCDPIDGSLPGSPISGILQQEYWRGLPFPSPGNLPDPGIELRSFASQVVSCIADGLFTDWATREALKGQKMPW